MKQIKTTDAIGHILCHDITRIIKGVTKDAAFRKGHVVREEDIPVLLSLGKEHLFVWEKQEGMLHENEAAAILYDICAGEARASEAEPVSGTKNASSTEQGAKCVQLQAGEVKEGKIEVIAGIDGLFLADVKRLKEINSLGEMMIATRHSGFYVKKGDKLAGTRVIPLVISKEKMEAAKAIGNGVPLLSVLPFKAKKIGVIATGSEIASGLIKDTFTPVLVDKTAEFGGETLWREVLGDDNDRITKAILDMIAKGAEMVLVSGGMSVDPDDKTPLAIKNTGSEIVSYGAPVLPGAMLLLSYYNGEIPVLGLPGCVMYAKRTVFDIILPRLMADVKISADELAGLGHGGLCLNCKDCIFPDCGFGKGM